MMRSTPFRNFSDYYARHITPQEALLMQRFCELRIYPWLTGLFLTASRLGDGPLWWASGIFFLIFGSTQSRWAVGAAAVAIGISVALFMAVKDLFGRPRPFETWRDLPCLLAPPDRFSFPSGHTMTAFAVCGVYSEMIPWACHFFLPAAVLIGLSRVFLGLHYPTDVLVGALLGLGIGTGVASVALQLVV
jgi:undecaprenyl-diphosphatase